MTDCVSAMSLMEPLKDVAHDGERNGGFLRVVVEGVSCKNLGPFKELSKFSETNSEDKTRDLDWS